MSPGTPDSTGSFAAVVTLESVDERVAGEAPAQRDVLAHAVHPHAVPVELEVDFVSRLEAQHIPKPLRNHDLPLRPYPGSHTSEYNRRRGRRSALQRCDVSPLDERLLGGRRRGTAQHPTAGWRSQPGDVVVGCPAANSRQNRAGPPADRQTIGPADEPRRSCPADRCRPWSGHLLKPATRLIVVATITVPNRYDSRACRRAVPRISWVFRSVSD